MESYYYLLSISFGYVFVSTCCVESYTEKQVWGRHTATTRWNSITKIKKFGKQWTKNHAWQSWTQAGLRVGHPASYMGRLAQHCAASPRTSSTVRFEPNALYFHMFRFSI